MTPDAAHWDELQTLFHLLEGVSSQDRERRLNEACADAEVRSRVLAILAASEEESARATVEPAPDLPTEQTDVGPYRLLERLGSGGAGTVYLAERTTAGVRQRVALKLLAPYAAGPQFVQRFEREQQILASLDHPYITRLLDAGVDEEGQPFLLMEYVAGQHLDRYCDEQLLTIPKRLQLFLAICEAVDYAHRNLVVHLDLKPSNILVQPSGTPKLLDFGTSKLLEADGSMTTTLPLTPSYASPEQLRNEPVTTLCDVYSLGAILFELLTGFRPGGQASLSIMIERALDEWEPPALETMPLEAAAATRGLSSARLRAALSGDLSLIARKCLSARPLDRYASVNALAEDVRRYLEGRPVLAQRQTTIYYLTKLVRRHRAKAVPGIGLLLLLASAGSYAFWQQRQAALEGARAARTQSFMNQLFRVANSNVSGKTAATVPEFLRTGTKLAPLLIEDRRELAEVECSLASSIRDSGNPKDAIPEFQQALRDAQAVRDRNSEEDALSSLATLLFDEGQTAAALQCVHDALAHAQDAAVAAKTRADVYLNAGYVLLQAHPGDLEGVHYLERASSVAAAAQLPPLDRAAILGNLAWADSVRRRWPQAIETAQQSLALYKSLPIHLCESALPMLALARAERVQRHFAESERMLRANYQSTASCFGEGFDLSLAVLGQWGYSLVLTGKSAEAIERLNDALPLARRTYAGRNMVYLVDLLAPLAMAYGESGQAVRAETVAREALTILQTDPQNSFVAEMKRALGLALLAQGKFAQAVTPLAEAVDYYRQKAPESIFARNLPEKLAEARRNAKP